MQILKGNQISEKLYLKTWELDNETFTDENKIDKNQALEWFYCSGKTMIMLYDEKKDQVIGYLFYFLLNPSFSASYITSEKSFKKITKKFFYDEGDLKTNIYIFSTVIRPEYRDKKIEGEYLFRILNNEFLNDINALLLKGIKINYVYAEAVTKDGEKYLKSLDMKPAFFLDNDVKFVRKFSLDMFKNCSNYEQINKHHVTKLIDNSSLLEHLSTHEYLSVKDNQLYYRDINLYDLVKKYGNSLEVAYLNMIPHRIKQMKLWFKNAIEKYNYQGNYHYAYATKANYYFEVVSTAAKSLNYLETSSTYDISIIIKLLEKGVIDNHYTIICNGFKNEKYIEKISVLLNKGINVIPIIENEEELNSLANVNAHMNVGLRFNSDFDSRLINNNFISEDEYSNRFGFEEKDIFNIASKIATTSNLTLKVFHFHFGGTITSINNYIRGYSNIFEVYCKLKKEQNSLEYFDFGGGFPIKYQIDYTFDYECLVDKIVKASKDISDYYQLPHPHLIGEHGRFTVADHSFFIYKVDFIKEYVDNRWYILNTSIMSMIPDAWAIEQEFTILPINKWDRNFVNVLLGGETCDPDDRYYIHKKNVSVLLPEIKSGEDLYVAVFSVGAYQENISGIGGVHHCMIPEGTELLISKDNKVLKVNDIQTDNEMLEILGYDDDRIVEII